MSVSTSRLMTGSLTCCWQVIFYHKDLLSKYIPIRASEIRQLHPSHIIFLMTIHDVETLRLFGSVFSNLPAYFVNSSLNKHPVLGPCMEAIGEKVVNVSLLNHPRPHILSLGHERLSDDYDWTDC